MATNNAINLKSSGIVSYDGAGTFSALANPLTVSNGGSGVSSTTAYAVLCGGTTSTGNIQSIASVGSSTNVLTSNGASALPTFQAATGGGTMFYTSSTPGNPTGGTRSEIIYGRSTGSTGGALASSRIYIPFSGTITRVDGAFSVQGTLADSTLSNFYLRKNGSDNFLFDFSLEFGFGNFAATPSIAVSAGDYIEVAIDWGSWFTSPTSVACTCSFLVT